MTSYKQIPDNLDENSAFRETLELLGWNRLGEQISTFAITSQCREKCKNIELPDSISISRRYIEMTLEIGDLDKKIEGGLNFLGVHDLEDILLRCLKCGAVSGEELLKVAETLRTSRHIRRNIDDSITRPNITALLADVSTLPDVQKVLEFGVEEGGRVADRASRKLLESRRKWQGLRLELRANLQHMIRQYNSILQDHIISERSGRSVLAVKATAADQLFGIVHDTSATGNTIFVEPQSVIGLGNRIARVESEIHQEEKRLLLEWSHLIGEHFEALSHLCSVMLDLELALVRARYSFWLNAVPPTLSESINTPFMIEKFRHPLLVWKEKKEKGEAVVPITFEVPSHLKVVAITGPNTGGKTIAMKSIGLAALMARAGFFLPCIGKPCLPWCYQVLGDIGDEQSLDQNLSTFSGHIVRIRRIFKSLSNSLGPSIVLLDEVGAGTDPTEGTALAIALLKTLADRARLTIATTHLGGVKSLKYNDQRFENASVSFDSETISPQYDLQWGIPGRSNALAIARRLGLDSSVINVAQDLIGPEGIEDVNKIIRGLEKQRKRQQEAAEDAASLLARTELLHDEILENWNNQRLISAEIEEKVREKLEASIRQGQKEVAKLIHRLRDRDASGETARLSGQKLRQMSHNAQQRTTKNTSENWLPKVGDRVRLIALSKACEVLEISDDGLELKVLCGLFRSTVNLNAVESLDGHQFKQPLPTVRVSRPLAANSHSLIRTKRNTIDVRGLRVHEAASVVEEKLRSATGPTWVIHGIGTGKLKKGLHSWLATLAYVDKVVDAEQRDGGLGCSVIWLS